MSKHIISIDYKKCIGCSMCEKDCVAHNITMVNNKAKLIEDDCVMCGHCAAICPKYAITISNYDDPILENKYTRLQADEVLDVIRFRRTIRQFQKRDIPDAVIEQILEAGRLTHTAKNMQDVSFVVLDKQKEKMEQLAINLFKKVKHVANLFSSMARRNKIHDHFFFFEAPKVIVIIAKSEINGSLAAQNMEFVAEANGLGVLYSGFFSMAVNHSKKLKKALKIPKGKKVITTLVLGYPQIRFSRSAQRESLDVRYL